MTTLFQKKSRLRLMNYEKIVGYTAALVASLMLWPLAYRTVVLKDVKSLSPYTIILQSIAAVLWIIYGVMRKDNPIILVQISILIANSIIGWCYLTWNKKSNKKAN